MRQSLTSSISSNKTSASRNRVMTVLAATGLALSMSACGAITEKITEEGAERIIEAETGENVELDIDGDGGISIQSEDGGITINEDGDFVVTDADGSVFTGSAGDDSLIVYDGDGNPVLDVDAENGEINLETEDGSASFGDDVITFESEGKTITQKTVQGFPTDWPADVPQPTFTEATGGSVMLEDDSIQLLSATGTVAGSASDAFDQYFPTILAAGFEEIGVTRGDGFVMGTFTSAIWSGSVQCGDTDGQPSNCLVSLGQAN